MKFLEALNNLEASAKNEISKLVERQKCLTLFKAIEGDDEWDEDIIDDIPDFPYYEDGPCQWAATMELRKAEGNIEVVGILKGNSYPNQVTVLLDELDAQAVITLADYITDRFE